MDRGKAAVADLRGIIALEFRNVTLLDKVDDCVCTREFYGLGNWLSAASRLAFRFR